MANDTSKLVALSASRIKTLESCSWLYWVTYHLKLPQVQNDGAKKGEICHLIFELLLDKKHKKHYTIIVKGDTIISSKAVTRLVKTYIKRHKLPNFDDTFLQIDKMILVGLKSDFFVKGGKLVAPEYKFDLTNETPRYHLKGFMDKPFIKGNQIIIDDFKSSKKKFEGEDQESNVQALMYSLASVKIWPDLTPTVRFIFLQYPDDPIMTVKFDQNTLKGFEYYLGDIQKKVSEFNNRDAAKHFAADVIPSGNEFKGKLICGFAKQPGQLKKDGTKMWHCPYKFGFDYFAIKDKDTNALIRCVFKKEDATLKPNEYFEPMRYDGCPKFRDNLKDFESAPAAPKKVYTNVLDDF